MKCKCIKDFSHYSQSGSPMEFVKNEIYMFELEEEFYIVYKDKYVAALNTTFSDRMLLNKEKFREHFVDPIIKRKEISDFINSL
jgi:hypothetical protein